MSLSSLNFLSTVPPSYPVVLSYYRPCGHRITKHNLFLKMTATHIGREPLPHQLVSIFLNGLDNGKRGGQKGRRGETGETIKSELFSRLPSQPILIIAWRMKLDSRSHGICEVATKVMCNLSAGGLPCSLKGQFSCAGSYLTKFESGSRVDSPERSSRLGDQIQEA